MKHLMLYESYDIHLHLKERGVDTEKTRVVIDDQTQDVYFFLYNLSGQMVGYQKYNPNYEKTGQSHLSDPRMAKYFNWVGDEGYGKKIAVWGLESVSFQDEFIFITEGIFDIARVHESGYPGIAVLCNDPSDSLKSWLKTLPQKKIVIYDNDKAGLKLKKLGDYSFSVSQGKDLNDLSTNDAKEFLDNIIKSIFREKVNESSEYYKKIDPLNIDTIIFDKSIVIKLQNLLYGITKDFFYDDYLIEFCTNGCRVSIYMENDDWYKVSVYLFNCGEEHYYLCDQYDGLLKFLEEVVGLNVSINESLFLAERGIKKLFVDNKELENKSELISKLNNSGFELGSGHEQVDLVKVDNNEYRLILIPYYGHPEQIVTFNKII